MSKQSRSKRNAPKAKSNEQSADPDEVGNNIDDVGNADQPEGENSPKMSKTSNKSSVSQEREQQSKASSRRKNSQDRLLKLESELKKLKEQRKAEARKSKRRESIGDPQTAETEKKRGEEERKLTNKLFEIRPGDSTNLIVKCKVVTYQGVAYAKEDPIPMAVATEYVKHRVAEKIKKRASHLDVDEVDKTIEQNEEPSTNSSITTESAKSRSEDLNRSQHSDVASHRVPPTVKFGPNWILREEHIQNIERTKGSGATDLTDQRLDVKLLGQERLSNEEATWQRKKTKFTADFKGYKE